MTTTAKCRVYTYWSSGVRDLADTPTDFAQYLVVLTEDCPEPGHQAFAIHALVDRAETEVGHVAVFEGSEQHGWEMLEKKLDLLHPNQAKKVGSLGGS